MDYDLLSLDIDDLKKSIDDGIDVAGYKYNLRGLSKDDIKKAYQMFDNIEEGCFDYAVEGLDAQIIKACEDRKIAENSSSLSDVCDSTIDIMPLLCMLDSNLENMFDKCRGFAGDFSAYLDKCVVVAKYGEILKQMQSVERSLLCYVSLYEEFPLNDEGVLDIDKAELSEIHFSKPEIEKLCNKGNGFWKYGEFVAAYVYLNKEIELIYSTGGIVMDKNFIKVYDMCPEFFYYFGVKEDELDKAIEKCKRIQSSKNESEPVLSKDVKEKKVSVNNNGNCKSASRKGTAKQASKVKAGNVSADKLVSHGNMEKSEDFDELSIKDWKPSTIKKQLDLDVIGQDEAKKSISIACYNHFKRMQLKDSDNVFERSNIMLIGASGCGKTEIVRSLSKILSVPMVSSPATRLTQAGFIGDDVESLLQKLITKANGDIEKAKYGIIYLDEVDKLAGAKDDKQAEFGERVQQALLTMVEGAEVNISVPKDGKTVKRSIDTSNILFIFGGAFPKIVDIVKKRVGDSNLSDRDVYLSVGTEDLEQFGMIPELIGRIPVLAPLEPLNKEALVRILVEPRNSICNQFKRMFLIDGVELEYEDGALLQIAERAEKEKTGARSLRKVMESVMKPLQFVLPDYDELTKVVITSDYVEGKGNNKYFGKNGEEILVEL